MEIIEKIIKFLFDEPLYPILFAVFFIGIKLIKHVHKHLNDEKIFVMDKILVNDESITSYKNKIEQSLLYKPSRYKEKLQKVLSYIDNIFGKLEIFSFKAIERLIIFSIIYSFLFFYLVWLFGGEGKIGELQLITNDNKLTVTLYLIFQITILYLLFQYLNPIENLIIKHLSLISSNHFSKNVVGILGPVVGIVVIVFVLVVVVVIGIGVGVIGIEVIEGEGGVVGVVGIILGIVLGIGGGVGVGVIGIGVIGVVLGAGEGGIVLSNNILYLLFFLILPLFNTIFDYSSMYFSRYYSQKIIESQYKWQIFLDLFIDLIIGIILFVGLALTLFYTLEFSNLYFSKDKALFIPIEHYKTLFCAYDFFHKDILWITLMFTSTLLPTFLHLGLALYSLVQFILVKPHLHNIVQQLSTLTETNNFEKEKIAYALSLHRLRIWIHGYILSAKVLLVTFISLLIVLSTKVT